MLLSIHVHLSIYLYFSLKIEMNEAHRTDAKCDTSVGR